MTAEVRIVAVAYVRIASAEPQAAARFAAEILGLEPVAGADGDIALRSDSRYRTLSLVAAPHRPSIGIEVWDDAALAAAEAALAAAGFAARRASPEECRVRYAMAAVLAQDGSGNAIDLVVRPMQSGRRYFPSRDAGITGLHDVALRSTAIARDRAFWTALGARISGYVGEITYLAIDDCHHRIALHPATRAGPLYAAFEVESLDQIMQNHYVMQERQVRIVQGPGRQPASGQIFLHVEGPDGMIYSYVHGMDRAPPHGRPPRQYPLEAESLCAWGSESQGVPELAAEGGA
jgi:2,3-dihydroxy-p-cumate/2,3-dihydroxybenzoate 3,4-dioxygenase